MNCYQKNSIINLPESLVKRLDQGIFSIYRYLTKAITVTVKKNAVKAAIDILLKSNAKKLSDIFINPSNFVYLLNK